MVCTRAYRPALRICSIGTAVHLSSDRRERGARV